MFPSLKLIRPLSLGKLLYSYKYTYLIILYNLPRADLNKLILKRRTDFPVSGFNQKHIKSVISKALVTNCDLTLIILDIFVDQDLNKHLRKIFNTIILVLYFDLHKLKLKINVDSKLHVIKKL